MDWYRGYTVNIPERQTLSYSNSWEDICTDHNRTVSPGFCKVTPDFCKVTPLQVGKEPGSEGLSFGNGTLVTLRVQAEPTLQRAALAENIRAALSVGAHQPHPLRRQSSALGASPSGARITDATRSHSEEKPLLPQDSTNFMFLYCWMEAGVGSR